MEGYQPTEGGETWKKMKYIDRSTGIEYTFDQPTDNEAPYLDCSVSFERKRSDARVAYGAMWSGSRIGMPFVEGDVTTTERNDIFSWGDQSRFGVLSSDGHPTGNLFIARKGTRIFDLRIAGVYFDDGEAFGSLANPALEAMVRYRE